jgi:hypothetical protein
MVKEGIDAAAAQAFTKHLEPILALGRALDERGRQLGLIEDRIATEAAGLFNELRAETTAIIRAIEEVGDAKLAEIRAAKRGEP